MKKHALQILSVLVAAAALAVAMGRPSAGSKTFWVTSRALGPGDILLRGDLTVVAVTGSAPSSAIPASIPITGRNLGITLPKGSFILPGDLHLTHRSSSPAEVQVAIPVPLLTSGLRSGASAVVLAWGSGPPVVLARQIPITGTSSGANGSSVSVSLPLSEAEAVMVAEASEKVAVLPWTP